MEERKKKKPIILVMAAGMGSRYGGLKQIDPVGDHGEIIMDFSLYDAMLAGFERAVFVIKKEMDEDFRKLVEPRVGKYMDLDYAYQTLDDIPDGYTIPEGREKPWGTAHAIYAARDVLDAPFCVVNSDDYYGPGAFQTIYEFLDELCEKEAETGETKTPADYAMVAFQLDRTLTENGHVARGVCEVNDNNTLKSVTERTKIMWRPAEEFTDDAEEGAKLPAFTEDDGKTWSMLPLDTPVSMNFWGFDTSLLKYITEELKPFLDNEVPGNPLKSEYLLPTLVEDLLVKNEAQVRVLKSTDQWYGVTYKADKEGVVNALQSMKDKGLYPDELWK